MTTTVSVPIDEDVISDSIKEFLEAYPIVSVPIDEDVISDNKCPSSLKARVSVPIDEDVISDL